VTGRSGFEPGKWDWLAVLASLLFLLSFGTSLLQLFCVPVCNSYVLHSYFFVHVLFVFMFFTFDITSLQIVQVWFVFVAGD
jgi:hypothetical protein